MAMTALHDHVLLVGSSQENELNMFDAATGGQLYTFKNCKPSRHGVQILPRTDHWMGIQDNKLALHLYTWGKDMPVYKCHIAEKMGPSVASSCGNYLFAGAESGKTYVWDVKTGELVMVWDAHYKRVTAVALTSDSSHLITAGEDAVVHVWRLMDLLDEPDVSTSFQSGIVPLISWTDHVLPVTSIHVGLGGVNARVYTSSLDRTCKIWSLNTTQCLFSITTPSFVNVCKADSMENRLFMGCGNGNIYVLDLHAAASAMTASAARLVSSTPLANTRTTPWESVDSQRLPMLEGHEAGVTTLEISSCGGFILSGDENGCIHVWDSVSRQSLRTIQLVKGSISALLLIRRPKELFHKHRSAQATIQEDGRGVLPVAPFRKYMGAAQVHP